MFRKLLALKFESVSAAAIIIGAAGLFSRLLGVIRDRVLAAQFGAGDVLDVYYAAFRLPDFVYNLVVLGALSAGFIPVFVELLKNADADQREKNAAAWHLANNVLNSLLVLLLGAGALLLIFAPYIIPWLTPGFSSEKISLTVNMTRVIFLSPLLLGLSGVFGGVLQSFKRFVCFSLSPILYNVGIIAGALFLTPVWGIYGLAAGVVIGCLAHLLLQMATSWRLGWRWSPVFAWRDKNMAKIERMMVPRLFALAGSQINLMVTTALASLLPAGSLAIFNFANNLQSLPLAVIGVSYAVAVFPVLSEKFTKHDDTEFLKLLMRAARQILFFIVPLMALLIILRAQIVRVVLGTGAFDWRATELTAQTLGIFCLALFAAALLPLFTRAFYARQNTIIPLYGTLLSLAVNAAAGWWLVGKFGLLGLSIAFSASVIVNFIYLAAAAQVALGAETRAGALGVLAKISLSTLALGAAAQTVKNYFGNLVDMQTFVGVFLQAALASVAGALAYVLLMYLLKSEEMMSFAAAFKMKLFGKFKVSKEGLDTNQKV